MSFLPWLILAVLAIVVVWVVMKQNSPLPAPGAVDPRGQPYPIAGTYGDPRAAGADAATATAIGNAVTSAFNLVGQLVSNSKN